MRFKGLGRKCLLLEGCRKAGKTEELAWSVSCACHAYRRYVVFTCTRDETVLDGEARRCRGWLVGSEARLIVFGGMFAS